MDGTTRDTKRAELRGQLLKDCESMADEILAALDKAPMNNIIGGSEWQVQDAVLKAKNRMFEKVVQAKADEADSQARSSFSPSGQGQRQGQGQEAAQQG